MKLWVTGAALVLVVGVLAVFLMVSSSLFETDPATLLQQADASYQAGEKASDIEERQRAFNQALKLYASLEERYKPTMGDGKLYYNIGNTFYQLEAYPWAILNGYRALSLRPRDERVKASLNSALSKLNMPPLADDGPFHTLLYFHAAFSLPERIQVFSALIAVAFIAFSFYLWRERRLWKTTGTVFATAAVIVALSLAYTYYLAPIEGVLIRSTLLYRDAGTQYAPVSEEPSPSGQKLTVLDSTDNGNWIKVETSNGTVGFIPSGNLRLIFSS